MGSRDVLASRLEIYLRSNEPRIGSLPGASPEDLEDLAAIDLTRYPLKWRRHLAVTAYTICMLPGDVEAFTSQLVAALGIDPSEDETCLDLIDATEPRPLVASQVALGIAIALLAWLNRGGVSGSDIDDLDIAYREALCAVGAAREE